MGFLIEDAKMSQVFTFKTHKKNYSNLTGQGDTDRAKNNQVKSKLKNHSVLETDHLVKWRSALQCFILSW